MKRQFIQYNIQFSLLLSLSEPEVCRHPGHGGPDPQLPGVGAPGGPGLGRPDRARPVGPALVPVTQHDDLREKHTKVENFSH